MNKKQTAVEWLVEQYKKSFTLQINDVMTTIIEQAKAMDKEQKKETWFDSTLQFDKSAEMTNKKLFEDYYNETYGKEN